MPRIDDSRKIQISKIEAAHRQLNTAIELWFLDKDEVSVHTLVAASYRIIHDINAHRKTHHETAFAPDFIKPEYHKAWATMVKAPSNFFKHADNDPEGHIDFRPFSSVMLMLYATTGLAALKAQSGPEERAFMIWLYLHDQRFLSPEGIAFLKNSIPVDQAGHMRPLAKKQFFETMMEAAANFHARQQS